MQNFTLNAIDHFRCLGADCPDSCCSAGWNIDVDVPTLNRWQVLPDSAFKQTLLKNLGQQEEAGATTYFVKQKPSGVCPFFGPDHLCEIQKTLGHDYLSETCQRYPRIFQSAEGITVQSLQLTCPESVRLILFPETGETILKRGGPSPGAATNPLQAFFEKLEEITFHGDSAQPLCARLQFIAWTLSKLAIQAARNQVNADSIQAWTKRLNAEYLYLISTESGSTPAGLQGWFWSTFFQVSPTLLRNLNNSGLAQTELWNLLTGASLDKESRFLAIESILAKSRYKLALALNPYQQAWENHIWVSLVNNGFPRNPSSGNHVATFIAALYPVVIAQLVLRMHILSDIPVNKDSIVELVYKTERLLSNTNRIFEFLNLNRSLLHIDQYWRCFGAIFLV